MMHVRLTLLCTLWLLSSGCDSSAISEKHQPVTVVDEHEAPGTLAEAINSVKNQGAEIVDAFKAGQPEDAHHQLHQIGHLIEALPVLGKQAALSEAEIKRVEEATEKLGNAFRALDESLHGKQTKSLDDVELEVQWALKLLEPMLSK